DRLAVRDSGGFVGHQSARAASFQELEAQAALAQPRFADDSDHLRITLPRARERRLEYLHLVAASDEAREPSRARHIEAGAHLPEPYQLVHVHRAVDAFDLHLPKIGEREVSLY